jgi:hypothetical protein
MSRGLESESIPTAAAQEVRAAHRQTASRIGYIVTRRVILRGSIGSAAICALGARADFEMSRDKCPLLTRSEHPSV